MRPGIKILTMLLCTPCLAQQWCAPGARWFHGESEYSIWGFDSYVETAYVGDVLFADSLCQALNYTHVYYNDLSQMTDTVGRDTYYTTSAPGIVHTWTGNAFDTLFHFNALPGEHWGVPGDMAIQITVLDTGHSVIDEHILSYQVVQVTLEDMTLIPTDTIYERIGPLYMYPYLSYTAGIIIDGGFNGLRCYSDNEMEYIRVVGACDIGLGVDTRPGRSGVTVFPNPTTGRFTVEFPDPLMASSYYSVYDSMGRLLYQRPLPTGATLEEVDLSRFGRGTYTIRFTDPDGVQHERVVLE